MPKHLFARVAPVGALIFFLSVTIWSAAGLMGARSATAAPAGTGNEPASRSVTVVGQGEVRVAPDLAMVTFGTETSNADLATAQRENAAGTEAVLAKLRSMGVVEQDLGTAGYGVFPRYDKEGGQPTGYRVINSVRATIRDLDTLGVIIDATVTAGANRVAGVRFDLADKGQAMQRAREAAVRDARAKAEQYAALVNGTLGTPLEIIENGATPQFGLTMREAAQTGGTPLEPGLESITVSVQITYELR